MLARNSGGSKTMIATKSSRRRNGLVAAVLIAAAVVAFLLSRRERPWSVAITSDLDEAPPWISFDLTGVLTGAPKDTTAWAFKWSVDDGRLESTRNTATWRSAS